MNKPDGVGSGLVAFPGADLQRGPMAVHEKPDDVLRIDTAFLAVSDLAELVFVLDLEMQVRHVIHHQCHVTVPITSRSQPGLVMSRPEMLDDPVFAAFLDHDLHSCRPGSGLHLPQERAHPPGPTPDW